MSSPADLYGTTEVRGDAAAFYHPSEEFISLRELLTIAFREKTKVIAAFIIPIALAIAAYIIIPATYTANMTLMVRTGPEYLAATQGGSASAPSSTKQEEINSEIEILESNYVAEEAIKHVGLHNIYPMLADSASGSAMDKAVKHFHADLSVDSVKLTNVISLSFKHSDADIAKSVLEAVLVAFRERHAAAFSSKQAEAYKQSIDQDVAELQALSLQREAIRKRMSAFDIDKQRADYLSRLKDIRTHLDELTDRRDALTARLAYLRQARIADPSMTTSLNGDSAMGYVQNALSDLKRTEATLLSQYGADHPRVKAVQAEIAGLQARISSLGNQEEKLDAVELAQYPGQAANYKSQINDITDRLKGLETADADLHAIDAKISSIDENLRVTRDHYEQARVLDDMNRAELLTSVNEIHPAMTSQRPTKPRKAIVLGIGLILGVIGASGVIMLAIVLNNRIVTSEGVERILGLPVLVAIPRVAWPYIGSTPQRE